MQRKVLLLVPLLALYLGVFPAFAAGSSGTSIISSIGISIIAATVLALIAQRFSQPLLIAYIAAGVLIGPEMGLSLVGSRGDIEVISEIGLVLLLFIIGLEMDMKKLRASGKPLLMTGVFQFTICTALGLLVLPLIVPFATGWALYYLASCLSLSSTAIVVKLLFSKSEIDTVPGRITLGVLVFQDLWAIVLLAVQPNLDHPDLSAIALSFGKGGLLIAFALLMSRYVLPRLFRFIARVPELLLIVSLSWCFAIAYLASVLSLSVEMGALIAGIAISTFPYNLDVIAKVVSIRDFFVTLFFVSLGMMIPNPFLHPDLLLAAFAAAAFLILSRFLAVSPILFALGQGHRISLIPAINLANVSEFSLVIATLGVSSGHIGEDLLSLVIFVFVITSIAAPYLIEWNASIERGMAFILSKLGLRDRVTGGEPAALEDKRDIVILGFFRVASSFLRAVREDEQRRGVSRRDSLFNRMVVVDFNPNVREKIETLGIKVVYGDIANKTTIEHLKLQRASLIISSVSDTMLAGTDNLKLVQELRSIAPGARIVVNAESPARALRMYMEGADLVLLTRSIVAEDLLSKLPDILDSEKGNALRDSGIAALRGVEEIIH